MANGEAYTSRWDAYRRGTGAKQRKVYKMLEEHNRTWSNPVKQFLAKLAESKVVDKVTEGAGTIESLIAKFLIKQVAGYGRTDYLKDKDIAFLPAEQRKKLIDSSRLVSLKDLEGIVTGELKSKVTDYIKDSLPEVEKVEYKGNNQYDEGEEFTDLDNDGIWDVGEDFTDKKTKTTVLDANGNPIMIKPSISDKDALIMFKDKVAEDIKGGKPFNTIKEAIVKDFGFKKTGEFIEGRKQKFEGNFEDWKRDEYGKFLLKGTPRAAENKLQDAYSSYTENLYNEYAASATSPLDKEAWFKDQDLTGNVMDDEVFLEEVAPTIGDPTEEEILKYNPAEYKQFLDESTKSKFRKSEAGAAIKKGYGTLLDWYKGK